MSNRQWKCPSTGKVYGLKDGNNFIHKFVGFCMKCTCAIDQVAYIEEFNFCLWKEVICKTCEPQRYDLLFKEN